jgi:class 3 adenylate cyclase/tetratricopeptide (TPR) repeat protein
MATCSSCGSENRPDRKFCLRCGQGLAARCPECGAANEPDAGFCGECGAGLAAATRPVPVAGTGSAAVAVARVAAGPISERRVVSVLFTDLVGFTTLAEGRDPEETRELLGRYFDMARDIVEKYAGTVEKFIGDAVMAVWGAPTAREDDAERAVRAALELVAAVRSLGPGLEARAGVLTGEAAVTIGATGQGMVAGDLVNTASRLQSVAAPGTVLVGEATRRSASSSIAFEPAGEQVLKGKAAPVPAFRALRVVAERGGRGRSDALEAPFVGRELELRLLRELFHATSREGRARLVSVIGPAGIGKSRLAWEFLKYIDGLLEEVWWHEGRSPAYGDGVSFWALGEMVRSRCGLVDTDDDATTRARVAATLAEHVPDESERRWIEGGLLTLLGIGDGKTATAELFGAWRTFFERLSDSGIVALVFEDFNNADAGLIDFVDHLLEWSRGRPIYVLTLARPELLDRRPDWQAKRNFSSLTLEPLSDSAMHELLAGLVPGLPGPAVRSIVARADGMPLYAVETVRMLLAEGKLELRDGVYVPVGDLHDLAVPETLSALISSRIDALDPADRALVHDAAVLGQSFTPAGLAAISGVAEAGLESHLRTLVRREILAQSADPRSPDRGHYSFVQALVREVAYNVLAKVDRKARHLAAARFFESLSTGELAGAVAGQYLAAWQNANHGAEADDLAAKARSALGAAAERARSLGSFEQAARFAEQAMAVATDKADRAALLEQASDALSRASRFEAAIARGHEAVTLWREVGDRRGTARAIAQLGRCIGSFYRTAEALALVDPAIEEFADLEGEPEWVALLLSSARACNLDGNDQGNVELCNRALAAAERLDLGREIAEAMVLCGGGLMTLGRVHEGIALIRGGTELADERGLAGEANYGRMSLAIALALSDAGAAMEANRVGLAECRRIGFLARAVTFAANAAETSRATGDWEWALDELGSFVDLDIEAADRAVVLAATAILRCWRGEDVAAILTECRTLFENGAIGNMSASYRSDLEAGIALADGRFADAVTHAREYARVSPLNTPTALPVAARAAVWMKDPTAAAADLAALDATGIHGAMVGFRRVAIRAAIAGLEGRSEEARTLFAEARRGLIEKGANFEAALVAIDMAAALGPDDPGVTTAAGEARLVLERLHALPFLARLDAFMAGSGR